jgi:ATP-dependent Clp protease, protease subunit
MKHKVNIKGAIISNNEEWVYELFGVEATSPRMVEEALKEAGGQDVIVSINSGGGSVFDGSEIYTSLRSYEGNVESQIVGLAASAASFIALAGDKVVISPTGQMMIHNAATVAWGDYHEMNRASDMLKGVNETIANAYKMKSGVEEGELLALMDKETWITPQMALEYKLVDEIMFENKEIKLAASAVTNVIPQKVIEGVRNGLLKNEPDPLKYDNLDEFVTKSMVENMLNEFKNELKPKEPEQVPAATAKGNLSKLFLNLN